MKRALALDMDDLLYPFMETLVPFYNTRFDTQHGMDDYYTFDFDKVWNITPNEAWLNVDACFRELDEQDTHPGPMNGADIAVPQLAEKYDLYIVTARGDEFHERTHSWLEKHFPNTFEGVFLCNNYTFDDRPTKRTKGSVIEELDAVGLVDDSASHITEVANNGRTAILFGDYAWNREREVPTNVLRAANWNEVLDLLMKED